MVENASKYFIDTNIIMYAAGKEHEYKTCCTNIIQKTDNYLYDFYINTEIIQEIFYRYSYINLRHFGIELAKNTLDLFDNILLITREDLLIVARLMQHYSFLISRDAIIIANMMGNNIKMLISCDRGFDDVSEIKRIDPKDFDKISM